MFFFIRTIKVYAFGKPSILYVLAAISLTKLRQVRNSIIAGHRRNLFVLPDDFSYITAFTTMKELPLNQQVLNKFFADQRVIEADQQIRLADKSDPKGLEHTNMMQIKILHIIQAAYLENEEANYKVHEILQQQHYSINMSAHINALIILEELDEKRKDCLNLIKVTRQRATAP